MCPHQAPLFTASGAQPCHNLITGAKVVFDIVAAYPDRLAECRHKCPEEAWCPLPWQHRKRKVLSQTGYNTHGKQTERESERDKQHHKRPSVDQGASFGVARRPLPRPRGLPIAASVRKVVCAHGRRACIGLQGAAPMASTRPHPPDTRDTCPELAPRLSNLSNRAATVDSSAICHKRGAPTHYLLVKNAPDWAG